MEAWLRKVIPIDICGRSYGKTLRMFVGRGPVDFGLRKRHPAEQQREGLEGDSRPPLGALAALSLGKKLRPA